ncbi:MAG TPA: hypothetical protein VKF63_06265 [Terracidiphilus sp.]|nr:hypothetical protein [Terracidiphilus sp.]
MPYATCDHLMEDGLFCSSPALRNQRFCYFHFNVRARRVQMARSRRNGESCRLHLPVLDNMHAVQAALQQVGDALAADRIDYKRASGMLYMLQQAAANLNNTREWEGRRPQVEAAEPFRALEAPDVAEEYDLPPNVDLALPPDAALEAAEQAAETPRTVKKPRRLERVPEHAADEADQYFHIPKDPGDEVSHDELAFSLSRLMSFTNDPRRNAPVDDEDDDEASPSRPAIRIAGPVNADEGAADVA